MEPFLLKVAEYINSRPMSADICVILPNRRAGLFLKKYLASLLKKPAFSPSIYSFEDFIFNVSGFQPADLTELSFILYNIHRKIEKEHSQPFEEFIRWGQVVLSDFNDINLHLADAGLVYSYLDEFKAMAVWNLNERPLTEFEQQYLRFFHSLYPYYKELINHLQGCNKASQGMAYRHVASNLEKISQKLKFTEIIFAGFNAITKSEEQIIKYFTNEGRGHLFVDGDHYYFDNQIHEAGKFLRGAISQISRKSLSQIGNYLKEEDKTITIAGMAGNVPQARYAGEVILEHGFTAENTAVVLADESLLFPLLYTLPSTIRRFNVTMGMPMAQTPLANFIDLYLFLHENAARLGRNKNNGHVTFYYKDVFQILGNAYVAAVAKEDFPALQSHINKLKESNRTFLSLNDFFPLEGTRAWPLLSNLLSGTGQDTKTLTQLLIRLIEIIRQSLAGDNNHKPGQRKLLENEYLFAISGLINRISSLDEEYNVLSNIKTYRNIFKQLVAGASIPFSGEPLSGLQIMGMLETRTLDFENIILLSVNEGFLPKEKHHNSFLPFDLRLNFGLPTYQERDAIFAYHFYRLLQRAKNIFLTYNSEPGKLGSGDKSRFINQVVHELPKYNPAIKINQLTVNFPSLSNKAATKEIIIEKNSGIMEQILKLASSRLSPSSLNAYRNCPMRFYLRYIQNLQEAEETEETIEASTMGTAIHNTLESFYTPFKKHALNPADISGMLSNVKKETLKAFKEAFPGGDLNHGKNLLALNVAQLYIENFLQYEKAFLEKSPGQVYSILDVEQELAYPFLVEVNGDGFTVNISGRIDRIDQLNGSVRVIDYKTGMVDNKELKIKDINLIREEGCSDKAFQLLTYQWLYVKTNPAHQQPIVPGIFSFRRISNGLFTLAIGTGDVEQGKVTEAFEEYLQDIVASLLNPEIPITQTTDENNCKYCPYTGICLR